MDVSTFLSNQIFAWNYKTEWGSDEPHTKRTVDNYWHDKSCGLESITKKYLDDTGQQLYASQFRNLYAQNISYHKSKIQMTHLYHNNRHRVYNAKDFWQTLVTHGIHVSNAMFENQTDDRPGMNVIRQMMKCVNKLTSHNGMRLEPFQLKAIRASICSAGERLLGDDLHMYVPQILKCVGLIKGGISSFDPQTCSEMLFKQVMKTFEDYSKSIVTVVAPRRNGKSKAGKLFVAANAACEKGARIVLIAHRLEAILLYKSEVRSYLEQILHLGLCSFRIHSSTNEIRIEFPDNSSSFVFFVSGGVNVSIGLHHSCSLCLVERTYVLVLIFCILCVWGR